MHGKEGGLRGGGQKARVRAAAQSKGGGGVGMKEGRGCIAAAPRRWGGLGRSGRDAGWGADQISCRGRGSAGAGPRGYLQCVRCGRRPARGQEREGGEAGDGSPRQNPQNCGRGGRAGARRPAIPRPRRGAGARVGEGTGRVHIKSNRDGGVGYGGWGGGDTGLFVGGGRRGFSGPRGANGPASPNERLRLLGILGKVWRAGLYAGPA